MIGVLLIAHGSRRKEANDDLYFQAECLTGRGYFVHPAFLELVEPTIPEAGQRLVDAGATHVILLPYFLSPGVHVHEDLEDVKRRFEEHFPQVRFHSLNLWVGILFWWISWNNGFVNR